MTEVYDVEIRTDSVKTGYGQVVVTSQWGQRNAELLHSAGTAWLHVPRSCINSLLLAVAMNPGCGSVSGGSFERIIYWRARSES